MPLVTDTFTWPYGHEPLDLIFSATSKDVHFYDVVINLPNRLLATCKDVHFYDVVINLSNRLLATGKDVHFYDVVINLSNGLLATGKDMVIDSHMEFWPLVRISVLGAL